MAFGQGFEGVEDSHEAGILSLFEGPLHEGLGDVGRLKIGFVDEMKLTLR